MTTENDLEVWNPAVFLPLWASGNASGEATLESACTDTLTESAKLSQNTHHFDYIIIANRGIIASMVMHEAHKAGKRVFVLNDRDDIPYPEHMLNTKFGDIVFPIHTQEQKDTRLKGKERSDITLINRIRTIMDDMHIPPETVAIHPGYGFNSEDPEWNEEVCRHFKVLAPSHAWIKLLGNKMEANRFCENTAIPLPIGSGQLTGREEARNFFRKHHKNVQRFLFKDVFGGGGKGQREVDTSIPEESFLDIFEDFAARHPHFIINEFIMSNRHIEMQVMVDKDGNIRFGPMRDCTLQRGKQKIIEEIAAGITPQQVLFLRKNITAFFKKGEQQLGHPYEGLATFEMMYLPTEKKFYFLEVNTRIQVEHPVSGHQGGIQFIKTQFDIAEGKALKSQAQLDAEERPGHTMEARICFERFLPETERNAFRKAMGVDIVTMPESGKPIYKLELPSGKYITVYMDNRIDTGGQGENGRMPNKQYDSMVIQVVARGHNREDARQRLVTAVETLNVSGPQTNKDFVLIILKHALFIKGEVTSDMSIVNEAMASVLAKTEEMHTLQAREQQHKNKEKQTDALLKAIQQKELKLPDAFAKLELPYVLSRYLGLIKPTNTQIKKLLANLGVSPDDLWQEEDRIVVHFPLQILVYDILETFGTFGVRPEPYGYGNQTDARFSVPHIIKPLFCSYLQKYGSVACVENLSFMKTPT